MTIIDTSAFYAQALGKATLELLKPRLSAQLPKADDTLVMGLGFVSPFLNAEARHISLMMARGGVLHWPPSGLVKSALVDELALPLPDNAVDAAVLVHALEFAESADELLAEVWRVLVPQGKLILVAPNRRGLWAVSDATPFGQGQPFSRGQLGDLLKAAQFSPMRIESALFAPPRLGPAVLSALEPGRHLGLGGVHFAVAHKQVHAFVSGKRVRSAFPRFKPVLLPGAQPAAKI